MYSKFMSTMNMKMSIMFMLTLWMMCPKEKTAMMEWNMIQFLSTQLKMTVSIDSKSSAFASCVLLITTAILMYNNYYMKESEKKEQFMKMIMVFIMSMMMLIFSPNMISMILGWEGLGMSSFILIMFYQNKKSLNSSFYTMLMNRMGDIMMMMSMINMMSLSSWNFTSTMFNNKQEIIIMMAIAAFSKSAQMPFSSWLTEAMAAPTPISALVHSSTLVTAGVFLFIRFEKTLKYSKLSTVIFLISMTTLIMASMNSAVEWDIKKVIALSTLSQMSMMFITISMNLFNLAMFHLLVHATFKALIFLCSSTLISLANTQDVRKMNKLAKNMFITKMSFNTANLSLSGFPFMSSFYSKEMIMEMMSMKKMNFIFIILFYSCMMMTLFYSTKMMMYTNQSKSNQTMIPNKETLDQKKSMLILLIPSITYGNKMNWTLNLNFKIPHLTTINKVIPMIMMMMMMLMMKSLVKPQQKMKNSNMKMMLSYMWFMKNMSISIKKMSLTIFFKKFKNSEKTSFSSSIKMTKTMTKNVSSTNFMMTQKTSPKVNTLLFLMMMLTL